MASSSEPLEPWHLPIHEEQGSLLMAPLGQEGGSTNQNDHTTGMPAFVQVSGTPMIVVDPQFLERWMRVP